jgi:transposase
VDHRPDQCWQCEGRLRGDDPSPELHPVWYLPRILAEYVEHRLHSLTCEKCGAVTKATLPPGVPMGRFCARLTAVVAWFAGACRLPQRVIQVVAGELFGVPMCVGSVAKQEGIASAAMAPAVEEAHQHLKSQPVVHADETSWPIAKGKGWLWVGATTSVAVFLVRACRGAKVAVELLGDAFSGRLVSDRWAAYNWIDTARRQLCWSHLLRQFEGFADHGRGGKRLSKDLLKQTRKMFRLWYRVRDGTLSRADFQPKMRPVEKAILALLERAQRSAHRAVAGRCKEILKLKEGLFTFVRIKGVEPTNNHGERVLRHAVIWRKGSYGVDSEAGATFVGRILTVVTSLRLQKRNVLDWMTEACEAHLAGRPGPSLLPMGVASPRVVRRHDHRRRPMPPMPVRLAAANAAAA